MIAVKNELELFSEKVHVGENVSINEEAFQNIFNNVLCYKPELKDSLRFISSFHIVVELEDYLKAIQPFLTKHYMEDEEWVFHHRYDFFGNESGFRGMNFQEEGIILVNLWQIIDDAHYLMKKKEGNSEDKQEAIDIFKKNANLLNLEEYMVDKQTLTNFFFWNNVFHEIRHTQQYLDQSLNLTEYDSYLEYKSPLSFLKYENDAIGFANGVFNEFISKDSFQVIKI